MRKHELLPYVGSRVQVVLDEHRGKQVYVCILSIVRGGEVFLRGDFQYRKTNGAGGIWVSRNCIESIVLVNQEKP